MEEENLFANRNIDHNYYDKRVSTIPTKLLT